MSTLVTANVDAWSTTGTAKVMTTSYVAGTAFVTDYADSLSLYVTTAGTATTSTQVTIDETMNGTTYAGIECDDEVIAAGVITPLAAVWTLPGANGTYRISAKFTPGAKLRVNIKRTDGSTDSTALAVAHLFRS